MREFIPIVFILLTAAVLPGAAKASDAEGCADLKLFPRLEGCVIVECSAKQHDSLETLDSAGSSLNFNTGDTNTNAVAYSCPAGDPQRLKRDFDAQLRKAGYLNITEEKHDGASVSLTARKNSQLIHWSVSSEDGATGYALTAASAATDKLKAEACTEPPVFSPLKQCDVVECTSKSEDSVSLRTAQKGQTALTGSVQSVTLACPSVTSAQAFSTVEGELAKSGFEIMFQDREHPENGWMTGRAGSRWVELVSSPDGESVSYAMTVVSSAEVLTAAKVDPAPVISPAATVPPAPEPERNPEPSAKALPAPEPAPKAAPEPAPKPVPAATAPEPGPAPTSAAVALADSGFVPPKPIRQVLIEPTHDRIYSVTGDVVINLLVDVAEDGSVTKAVLTGRITKDVLKLESAAVYAVSQWRFEPAQQNGRIVAAVKIPAQMHFHGKPWRY
jgi:hypothetical protein